MEFSHSSSCSQTKDMLRSVPLHIGPVRPAVSMFGEIGVLDRVLHHERCRGAGFSAGHTTQQIVVHTSVGEFPNDFISISPSIEDRILRIQQ